MAPETFTSATEVVPNLTILDFDIYSFSSVWGSTAVTSQGMSQTYSSTIWGSTAVTSPIEEVLNKLHQDWIKIPKPAEVRAYLLRYSDLTDLLPFVCKVARERVGIDPELSLEVYHDPEIEDDYLTLYLRHEHYNEHILEIIEDIRTQYERKLVGRSGWLLVTTDFCPPK